MIAADVMAQEIITIGPDESVASAAALMTAHDVSALPVISTDGRLVGIISEADLLRREEIAAATNPSWINDYSRHDTGGRVREVPRQARR